MNNKIVYEEGIPEILTKYLRMGFKLVPLGNDSILLLILLTKFITILISGQKRN